MRWIASYRTDMRLSQIILFDPDQSSPSVTSHYSFLTGLPASALAPLSLRHKLDSVWHSSTQNHPVLSIYLEQMPEGSLRLTWTQNVNFSPAHRPSCCSSCSLITLLLSFIFAVPSAWNALPFILS